MIEVLAKQLDDLLRKAVATQTKIREPFTAAKFKRHKLILCQKRDGLSTEYWVERDGKRISNILVAEPPLLTKPI